MTRAATRAARTAAVGSALLGTLLQVVQHTDGTPALAYFTVDSALLYVLAQVVPRSLHRTTGLAAVAGMLLSALVFWVALAPVNGIGLGDPALLTANVLLHAIAPAAAAAAHRQGWPGRGGGRRRAIGTLWWPVGYGAVILTLSNAGHVRPYEFLSSEAVRVPVVVAASVGALAVYLCIAAALCR